METQQKDFPSKVEGAKKVMKKWVRNLLIFLIIALAAFVYIRYFFVFGTGVKAGQLNYVVHKGYVFKTYEGKLIQAGYRAPKQGQITGTIQSNEFEFSIANKRIADSLMLAGGKDVELHYKEYFGAIPWRGNTVYVVDSIIAIK